MTMKTNEIETRVKKIVVEQLGVKDDEVTTDASFVDDLGADSLDTVELVMALEEEFETTIPDEDAEKKLLQLKMLLAISLAAWKKKQKPAKFQIQSILNSRVDNLIVHFVFHF